MPQEKLNEENQDLLNLHSGLKMTEKILMQTLQKHGLERFDPDGQKFDPNKHEATFTVPMKDKEDGSVFHVQSKGFTLNGRIIRVRVSDELPVYVVANKTLAGQGWCGQEFMMIR